MVNAAMMAPSWKNHTSYKGAPNSYDSRELQVRAYGDTGYFVTEQYGLGRIIIESKTVGSVSSSDQIHANYSHARFRICRIDFWISKCFL